ncbi:hypothetical protein NM961_05725 [Tahibacter sp. P2K]|uniref:Uncharacterized protein n=1 Tax=Tahibacter harae TaxID=2963937 RepID=A0ABT1QPJ6_9GAMM|nr:hypothetical protein [Tahibacter harae]MCQ4164206.1 hypothetical protein [Tahibacter harae]
MQLPQVGRYRLGQFRAGAVEELVAEARLGNGFSQRGLGFRGGMAEVSLERLVLRAQRVFVDVAVLDDQRTDARGLPQRQAQADLRAEIVQIQGEARHFQTLAELLQEIGVAVEVVGEILRRAAVAAAGKIRREQAPAVGQARQQVAIGIRRAGIAVRQQQDLGIGRAGFAIEHGRCTELQALVRNQALHDGPPSAAEHLG